MLLQIPDGVSLPLSEGSQIVVTLFLLLSFIWLFIFLSFTMSVNSNSSRFCSIWSLPTLIEGLSISVEPRGWSVNFLNL